MKTQHSNINPFSSPATGLALALFCCCAFCEKVLVYDEEKGIMFVDKNAPPKKEPQSVKSIQPLPEKIHPRFPLGGKTVDASIQSGRQKDPPEVYFESGLQYFKNKNFDDALKNFTHADELDPQAKYVLWMGKTLRQMGNFNQQMFLMDRILTTYPESDVADDALFEKAFYYQSNNNYALAIQAYTRLAEQYPFGTSFSNGENFREIAHKQIQVMRAEILSTLKLLGYTAASEEALFGAFQKDKGLEVTGTGTAQTIQAIKSAQSEFLQAKVAREKYSQRLNKYRAVALAVLALLAINALVLYLLQRRIIAQRKHCAYLEQTLSDLTTGVS